MSYNNVHSALLYNQCQSEAGQTFRLAERLPPYGTHVNVFTHETVFRQDRIRTSQLIIGKHGLGSVIQWITETIVYFRRETQ